MKLATALLLLVITATAHAADIKIPGTQVSYSVKTDAVDGSNSSMVFIDDPSDKSGKTYVTFACKDGDPYLRIYSKNLLGTTAGETVQVSLRADAGVPRYGEAKLREDNQTGRLSVLEQGLTPSAQALGYFLSAKSKVVMRFDRTNGSAITYTFPTKGFAQGYRAVKSCD